MDTMAHASLSNATLGCCSRYRQCSDAKRCLLEYEDSQRARQCAYRINLEQGKIFYGKNATDFSIEQYEKFQNIYDNTDGALRKTLDDLILYIAGNAYLTSSVIWFYSAELDQLQTLGVISYQRNHRFVLDKYTMKELKGFTDSKLMKKEDIINHIICDKPDIVQLLSEPYCYVQVPSKNRKYVLELYYDHFYTTEHCRYTGPLPFPEKENADAYNKR